MPARTFCIEGFSRDLFAGETVSVYSYATYGGPDNCCGGICMGQVQDGQSRLRRTMYSGHVVPAPGRLGDHQGNRLSRGQYEPGPRREKWKNQKEAGPHAVAGFGEGCYSQMAKRYVAAVESALRQAMDGG